MPFQCRSHVLRRPVVRSLPNTRKITPTNGAYVHDLVAIGKEKSVLLVEINRGYFLAWRACSQAHRQKPDLQHPTDRPSPRPTTATPKVRRLQNSTAASCAAGKEAAKASSCDHYTPSRSHILDTTRGHQAARDARWLLKAPPLRRLTVKAGDWCRAEWSCCLFQYVGRLSQTAGLALPLEQAEDVALANRTLDVADDGAGRVVQELHTHLPVKHQKQRDVRAPSVNRSQ